MGLNTNERQKVTYFTGFEVEHTIAHGMFTLFVVGTPPLDEILKFAKEHMVEQIYFGTSQSFTPKTIDDWDRWDQCIQGCLQENYWVTLDFDVSYSNLIHEYGWNESDKFISMISVKLPNIRLFNYNTTIKIDDTTWGHSNPGVWCHSLNELTTKSKFTFWDQYEQDDTIK